MIQWKERIFTCMFKVPGVRGNVHTGATPPWLRDDDYDERVPEETSSLIGPSLDDFILHSE